MLSFRASSLSALESCPRRFAAEFVISAGISDQFDLPVVRRPVHIGALIGTACHVGFAEQMREVKRTGEHGSKQRLNNITSAATSEFATISREAPGVITDATTASKRDGVKAVTKIVERFFWDIKIDGEPEIIEKGGKAIFPSGDDGDDFQVTGTLDLHIVNANRSRIEDHKTGRNRPQALAQIGIYSLLIKSNGKRVNDARINYSRRVAFSRPQPHLEKIAYDLGVAEHHALTVAREANRTISRLLKTGDANTVVANPSCYLCSPKFCPAYGTNFCHVGIASKK